MPKTSNLKTTSSKYLEGSTTMFRLGKAIRRHRETIHQEREVSRALRSAAGSNMRSELTNLAQYSR